MSGASIRNAASITGVVGKSGSGKGLFIKERLRAWRGPVLVWSPLEDTDDYCSVIKGTRYDSIAATVAAIKQGKTRVVFDPGTTDLKTKFDRFCRMAWELPGWCVVIEELSQVTTPSWAPIAWKKLTTAGRHRGLNILGASQRPAQVDKDFFGNCSEIRCYAVGYMRDAKAMADALFCDPKEILALPRFHYMHRYVDEKRNELGVVKVPKS